MEVLLRLWLPAALFEPPLAQMPWNRVREEKEQKRENDIEQGGYTEGGRDGGGVGWGGG